jgi:hypothetical protein
VNSVLKSLLRRFYAPQMEALAEREAAKVSSILYGRMEEYIMGDARDVL